MTLQQQGRFAVGLLSLASLALSSHFLASSYVTSDAFGLCSGSTGLALLSALCMLAAHATPTVASASSGRSSDGIRWKALLMVAIVAGSHMPSAEALLKEPAQYRISNMKAGGPASAQPLLLRNLRGGFSISPEMAATAHAKTAEEVCQMCGVDQHAGLSEEEAKERLELYGPNQLPSKERVPLWKRFLAQFDDKMVKILLVAAGISSAFAIFDAENAEENPWVEPCVIMSILILNACIGVWQESNAEAAIEALSSFNPDQAKVVREQRVKLINAKELVPGDIVEVAVGDKIPADIRVVELQSTTLKAEQAALTGEAASVNKAADYVSPSVDDELATKENMMFSATDLVYGKARGVVVKTGKDTEIGKIAQALTEVEDQESPLKEKLDKFGDLLTDIITVICIACWAVNIPQFAAKGRALTGKDSNEWSVVFKGAMYFFKIAVVLAVAAIPEGLPAVVTTCLALGTRRLAAKNALVRHLPAVETLGCCSIICSDKTGTLTTNQMSVQKVLLLEKPDSYMELDVEGSSYEPKGRILHGDTPVQGKDIGSLWELSMVSSLCNLSGLNKNAQGVWERIGESTEAALKVLAEKVGLLKEDDVVKQGSDTPAHDYFDTHYDKLATLEFNRERKSMSVLVGADGDEKGTLLVKGATEMLLKRCTKVRLSDGTTVALSNDHRQKLIDFVESHYASGDMALRCLGHAILDKKIPVNDPRLSDPKKFEDVESDLTFIGLTGILDPPREEVKDSIRQCKEAGIRVMVITGDNPKTAETICRMIGIFEHGEDLTGKSFTGREFSNMSPAEKAEAVCTASLFSRTEPIHKKDIVQLLQVPKDEGGPGHTAAMTGDGVNDAPALKAADIGVAMGSGTSVAQGAAKMVLADDNFTTIVRAVEEGRAIYANTKAFIRYLISSNIGEVVCVFLSVILGLPEVLSPVALLWVNLVTDGLPATALSFNPAEPGIMTRPPRSRADQLVDGWMLTRYLMTGAYVGVATVWGYIWWMCKNPSGPLMTFQQLRSNLSMGKGVKFSNGYTGEVFHDKKPGTLALSVLVTIEMFNALNAVTESKSLLSLPPWKNMWLMAAVCLSFAQHLLVLSWPAAEIVFHVKKMTLKEWKYVVALSFPIIILDEAMKGVSRHFEAKKRIPVKPSPADVV
eukprot:CAMPEP_0181303462 /NCGR_PEP_ID=MMETSP1101-20121128/8572_1 /TAXON_ID=46948 /ORGANISM="Rhodomonas abbreviata, Strain Caron Lab Isolate" /LENGTH=1146 /DNA_ID=CAMNT_0023409039 /DNA_START=38 /DNA_END=3478 /DNA_ORIENTATION=-